MNVYSFVYKTLVKTEHSFGHFIIIEHSFNLHYKFIQLTAKKNLKSRHNQKFIQNQKKHKTKNEQNPHKNK
jgi:hypothetical protein